jgi:hypothetical protein
MFGLKLGILVECIGIEEVSGKFHAFYIPSLDSTNAQHCHVYY